MKKLNIEKLFKELSELKSIYDEKRESDRFNIVSIFHNEREEKLHSRVISYLLSPTSGHGMKQIYCDLFVKNVLKLDNTEFDLSNFKVLPNEEKKSEYKFIDILIINKTKSQAIIVENKIDAHDSNHIHKSFEDVKSENDLSINFKKTRYIGQLDRYYHTIKTGFDKDRNPCPETMCENIFVYYLSPNGKSPDEVSNKILKNIPESWNDKSIISYDYNIREWLKECIEKTPKEKILVKEFIQHYLKIVDKMTHNEIPDDEKILLKNIVSENIDDSKYLIENFKHVKWHTLHEFWTELVHQIENSGYKISEIYPNDEAQKDLMNKPFKKTITEITHFNKSNLNHGILFDLKNGDRAYISSMDRLSWGNLTLNKWGLFKNEKLENINFSDFSSENTFSLINKSNMENAVSKIIDEINESANNNFENLQLI
ncbi:MAG: PD-(D/E)XK nuclease family protein [Bacteroidota bacterium]